MFRSAWNCGTLGSMKLSRRTVSVLCSQPRRASAVWNRAAGQSASRQWGWSSRLWGVWGEPGHPRTLWGSYGGCGLRRPSTEPRCSFRLRQRTPCADQQGFLSCTSCQHWTEVQHAADEGLRWKTFRVCRKRLRGACRAAREGPRLARKALHWQGAGLLPGRPSLHPQLVSLCIMQVQVAMAAGKGMAKAEVRTGVQQTQQQLPVEAMV